MAALALRGKHDPGSLLASLSGSQRYVLDYLAEEVFRAQTLEVRRFLLGTSLLERFNSTLCAEVLQDTRAIVTLAALERDNLFIIPLDDAARDAGFHWYRYHHLFADLLKMRAAQDPDLHPAELHRRAAAWFERNGWTTDAVHHTILAGDHRHAAELVEQHTLALFSQGELNRLLGWINMLPVEVASQRPRLKLYQAWATAFAGRIAETEQLIEQAEQLATKAGGEVTEAALMADAACIRGVTAAMTGRFDQALALETLPGDLLEGLSPFTRCGVDWALGFAYRGRGDLARAGQAFEHMLITARGHHLLWTLITASVDYGAILRLGGNLRQAEAVYREALATATQAGAASSGYLGRLESFLANILYEQNRLEEAGNVVQASIAHNRFWQNANHIVHAYLAAARIEQAKGNRAAAAEALRQADDAAQAETLVTTLRAGLEAVQVRIWLDAGDMARALRWARDRKAHLSGGTIYDEAQAQILVGIARVLHAAGERGEAWAILSALAEQLQQRSLVNPLIEVLTLKAQCAPAQGEALAVLEQALRLGLPEGYARTFLDEGPRVLGLLQACRASGSLNGELRIYLDDLLRQAGVPAEPQVSGVPTPLGLTGRELEILAAMSRGLNNQQIGAALFISAGTVKAHSASIYRKLNVANRTEAIARAKDSRLI
jgi:LuxR family maltose regulon positive regulatory protein